MSSKDLTAFLAWAEENEILWDKSAVEIKEGKHGLGLYAKRHLDAEYEGALALIIITGYRLDLIYTNLHSPFVYSFFLSPQSEYP